VSITIRAGLKPRPALAPTARACAVAAVAGVLVGLLLSGFGGVLGVASASMAPAIEPGDAVLVRMVPADRVTAGNIVTFRDPHRGVLLTHRVVSTRAAGGRLTVVTRGDANTGSETWSINHTGRVGLFVHRVPWLGYPLALLGPEQVLPTLYLITIALCASAAIRRIWYGKRPPARRPATGDAQPLELPRVPR
jgi:signal peptidase